MVNPAHIAFVTEQGDECVIHFASGTSIEVYESYNEISIYLEEALDDLDS